MRRNAIARPSAEARATADEKRDELYPQNTTADADAQDSQVASADHRRRHASVIASGLPHHGRRRWRR